MMGFLLMVKASSYCSNLFSLFCQIRAFQTLAHRHNYESLNDGE